MKGLVIRSAERKDIESILYFINELASFEKLEDQVKSDYNKLERNLFENKYAEVIMLELKGKKIGFALYFYTFSTFESKPTLYLEDLFVIQSERHNGYGKEALKYLANMAINKGCARFEWSCLNWNKDAIDFYLKFGALPQNEWTLFRLEGSKLIGYSK